MNTLFLPLAIFCGLLAAILNGYTLVLLFSGEIPAAAVSLLCVYGMIALSRSFHTKYEDYQITLREMSNSDV